MVEAAEKKSAQSKSPSDMIEKRLGENPWLGGEAPSKLDLNRFKSRKEQPNEVTHPKAFAWYDRMSKMSEEQLNGLKATVESEDVSTYAKKQYQKASKPQKDQPTQPAQPARPE